MPWAARAAGLLHGAKAITLIDDAMCAPDDGVTFRFGADELRGGGDLSSWRRCSPTPSSPPSVV